MKKNTKLMFVLSGLTASIWFLVRVIPKPSRATYPCMQAAYPLMSGFVIWIISMTASVFSVRKVFQKINARKWFAVFIFSVFSLISLLLVQIPSRRVVYANSKNYLAENISIGQAKGIYPGRVVWIWNPDATNENCTNLFGDGWFMDKNTNLEITDSMARQAVIQLTGGKTVDQAWEKLFRYHNLAQNKGDVGYQKDEKIFIKVNFVSSSSSTFSSDYTILNTKRYGMSETSPQLVLSVLRQLVNDYGIPQNRISVGDPIKHIYKHVYQLWHNEFPDVNYMDHKGTYGRTKAVSDNVPVVFYSDRGTVMITGNDTTKSDALYNVIKESDYMINIGALKAHARAGVSLCAKNHFGSHSRSSASHLHKGLVSPDMIPTRTGYEKYRVQVDLMGHKLLGAKTLVFIVDGLWGGSEANDPPRKWALAPFNNDWSSSIFISQDPVAIESVGYDFLKAEFTAENPFGSYPQIPGTDDYLMQAADSSFWPEGIVYDPENDGIPIQSLGVFEHWNNPEDKKYSRNLKTGDGIELVSIEQKFNGKTVPVQDLRKIRLVQVYPNPATNVLNISCSNAMENVTYCIYDLSGRIVQNGVFTDKNQIHVEGLTGGTYILNLIDQKVSVNFIKL